MPTVLVTGAGGPAGVSVVNALRARGDRVVAADADPTAVGLRLADVGAVLPRFDHAGFLEELCKLASRTRASVLISTLAEEMLVLGEDRAALAEAGLATWLPEKEALQNCLDKWRFAAIVAQAGLPLPRTALGAPDGVPPPWIVKPRFGRGSRHVYPVDRESDLQPILGLVPQPIVQTRLEGSEFTVDVLVDRDGALAGAVPRWRLETRGGISVKGRTFRDDALLAGVAALVTALGLRGVANVQGFAVGNSGPPFSFVEVNPRFSGGLPLALAAGADLVGEYVRGAAGLPIRRGRLRYRAGVTMSRYFQEVFDG
jgi:carbamoyl-phosphate synthase large subunit